MTAIISDNADNRTCVIREKNNALHIRTKNKLTDDQMRDLFWIAYIMSETGLELKQIITK